MTSSNENSIILDFFCGSGTALVAANQLSRKWIGIDSSIKAIETAEYRLDAEKNLFSTRKYCKIDLLEQQMLGEALM